MSKQIITISREFGSGGRSVGRRVAELLDVPYYDKELVKQVAVETGFDEKFIEQEGEYASPWQSLLSYAFAGGGSGPRQHMNGLSTSDFLWVIQCRVILELADKGSCGSAPMCSTCSSTPPSPTGRTGWCGCTASQTWPPRSGWRRRTSAAGPITSTTPTGSGG